jgi:hypothetical protein
MAQFSTYGRREPASFEIAPPLFIAFFGLLFITMAASSLWASEMAHDIGDGVCVGLLLAFFAGTQNLEGACVDDADSPADHD